MIQGTSLNYSRLQKVGICIEADLCWRAFFGFGISRIPTFWLLLLGPLRFASVSGSTLADCHVAEVARA